MRYFTGWWLSILIHIIICLSLFHSKGGVIVMGRMSNETDRLALLAFKAKITEDPLGIMSLWNDTSHFCQWYGVTCSTRHQRVTRLDLPALKLGGSISPHIGNLSFLHVLELEHNSFSGQIPPEIGRLHRLQTLILYYNTFGGKIPRNLSSCFELRFLDGGNNNLEGEIPLELGSLSKLQELYFSENNLVGKIPNNLTSLSHLTLLDLYSNHLSDEVPSLLFNLSNLESLDIGTNHLGPHIPGDIFHTLPNLQFMSIMDNQFRGPIPSSLSNASNLQILQLSNNGFTGKVPCLEKLYLLRVFSVHHNNLGSGVRSQDDLNFLCSLTNATLLELLQVDSNSMGGLFPTCITKLSSKLRLLNLDTNFISGSIPQAIDNLTSLTIIDFGSNSFTGMIPPTIGNLQNLVILNLFQNHFSGWIPTSLGKLIHLNNLDLSFNNLEGTIPTSLQNCTDLQFQFFHHNKLIGLIPPQVFSIRSLFISVSYNQLIGPLPEEIGNSSNLDKLDVSGNMLSGKIPDTLGKCLCLELLYMDNNNFQGGIPSFLSSMKGLLRLDLSSNNLSGPIPQFLVSLVHFSLLNLSFNDFSGKVPKDGVFTNSSITSLRGNNKLCGGIPEFHLPECSSFPERRKRKCSVKNKITIVVVVGLAGVALVILLVCLLRSRRRKSQSLEEHVARPSENPPLQFVTYGDLYRATNGFSGRNLIGKGSFGNVYRGTLGEGEQIVAIKVLNLNHHGASKSFVAECEALRNIRHKSLVKLLTVCSGVEYQGNEFKALVYEFMSSGSLEDWLHPPPSPRAEEVVNEQTPPTKLGLRKRLSIALDVSSLLEYVHHEFGTPLVHCDIKPSNILLDDDLSGYVSDFGLARFLSDVGIIRSSIHASSSTGVRGTVGYAPPEYGIGSEVSTQGDVYSYGILLLEMFTGKKPTHEMFKEGLNLHLYSKMALSSGVIDILDPTLQDPLDTDEPFLNPRRSKRVMDCLVSLIEVGVACSLEAPAERMDMRMAAFKLHKMKDVLFTK